MAAADINGDGNIDLIIGGMDGTFCVLPGNGDGSFRPKITCPVPSEFWAFLAPVI